MKSIALILSLTLVFPPVFSQTSELAKQHSQLTTQCKSIRGHAGRIVAETGEPTLNRDVALAHLGQIEKFREQMEQQLASSKKLLNAEQSKLVAAEYKSLGATCSAIEDFAAKLRKELEKKEPVQTSVRELAGKLRSEMSGANEVHERLKKKLGIS